NWVKRRFHERPGWSRRTSPGRAPHPRAGVRTAWPGTIRRKTAPAAGAVDARSGRGRAFRSARCLRGRRRGPLAAGVQVPVVQQRVEDQRVGAERPPAPHRVEAEHHDVALAQLHVDEGGGVRQLATVGQPAADEQIPDIRAEAEDRAHVGGGCLAEPEAEARGIVALPPAALELLAPRAAEAAAAAVDGVPLLHPAPRAAAAWAPEPPKPPKPPPPPSAKTGPFLK